MVSDFFCVEQATGHLGDREFFIVDERVVKGSVSQFGQRTPELAFVKFGELIGFVFFNCTALDKELEFPNRILDENIFFEFWLFAV